MRLKEDYAANISWNILAQFEQIIKTFSLMNIFSNNFPTTLIIEFSKYPKNKKKFFLYSIFRLPFFFFIIII